MAKTSVDVEKIMVGEQEILIVPKDYFSNYGTFNPLKCALSHEETKRGQDAIQGAMTAALRASLCRL